MAKYKKDKMLILKELRELLAENVGYDNLDPHNEEDVANLIIELSDKRRIRKLKKLLKEFDAYMKTVYTEEKLKKEESMYYEDERKCIEARKLYSD